MRVFEEKQRFTQWWIQLINLTILGLLVYACFKWFVLKENFGNVSSTNYGGQAIGIGVLIFAIALLYIFKLETIIDERGVLYRFFPFHRNLKLISWNLMEKCYTREYRPLTEYGGWGYRFGLGGGQALNVKGNQGIQLKLKNGTKLLIGTQKPRDAQSVINNYFKNERV